MISAQKSLLLRTIFACFFLFLFLIPTGLTFSQTDFADSFQVSYCFSDPIISNRLIQNQTYSSVEIPSLKNTGDFGSPFLPVDGAYILLPPGRKISSISVKQQGSISLSINNPVLPTGNSRPISNTSLKMDQLMKDDLIYDSYSWFPVNSYKKIGVFRSCGYDILVLELYPVRYHPQMNRIRFSKELTVVVETEPSEYQNMMIRSHPFDKTYISNKVDNPDFVRLYPENKIDDAINELAIITSSEFESVFRPLKKAHDNQGIHTIIRTLDEIGETSPSAIRSYIKQLYQTEGIRYVLIGGDDDVVPAQHLYVSGLDEGTDLYETTLPSDLFYACLDGPYNNDEDSLWGETTDGLDGDDVDLMADVFVGRASVSNKQEAEIFVEKTISFINGADNADQKKALYVGEYLGNYGIASYGANYLDQLMNNSSDDNYTTTGIPSELYESETLYDRDGKWSRFDLFDLINQGVDIVNHLGHSNYYYNMKMDNANVFEFQNDRLCFIYSQGCMAGGFDQKDCIAETFTIKQPYGAVAGIWNARYGWFWSFSTDGDSQRFHREFWDAIFGEEIPMIGMANHDSKEDNLYLIDRSCIRWVYYETNLFGDPTLSFYQYRPAKPIMPTGPEQGKINTLYTYSSNTTDPNDDLIYYQWDGGDGRLSEWIGPFSSGEHCFFNYTWDTKGSFSLRVRAKDSEGYCSAWSNPLTVSMPLQIKPVHRLFSRILWYVNEEPCLFI